MDMLAIRLTRSASDLVRFYEKVDAVCSQQIWFEHKADGSVSRTHVHGIVEGLTVSVETLRNWLRFDTLWAPTDSWSRSDWSFKEQYKSPFGKKAVDVHMITYMSKGKLEPAHRKGFDEWRCHRDAWVEPVRRQKKIDAPEQPTLDKQITHWEMLDQVRRLLDKETNPTEECIIEKIIQVHRIHQKLLSRYKIRDFYDSYKAYYGQNNHQFIESIISLCKKT